MLGEDLGSGLGCIGAFLGALGVLTPTLSLWPWGGKQEFCWWLCTNLPLCSAVNRAVADTAHVAAQSCCSQTCSATSPLKA